jgi:hypothetical protein
MTTTPVVRGNTAALSPQASAVLKTGQGRVYKVIVNIGGSNCAIHDCASVGAATVANRIFAIPITVGAYDIECPYQQGCTFIFTSGRHTIIYS